MTPTHRIPFDPSIPDPNRRPPVLSSALPLAAWPASSPAGSPPTPLPLPIAVTRRICGRDFIISETRRRNGSVSRIWQALPGTASDRPRGFRAGLFQPASEACLAIVAQRQDFSSDAIADLERRSRLRPPERGWIARRLAEAVLLPHITHPAQILSVLRRVLPRIPRADQGQIVEDFITGLSSADRLVRLRSREMLEWILTVREGRLGENSAALLRLRQNETAAPVQTDIRGLLATSRP